MSCRCSGTGICGYDVCIVGSIGASGDDVSSSCGFKRARSL